jgi:hypothetical protein
MTEPKIIKEIGLNGKEITYIVDPSLNCKADRLKVPKKYEDFNEVHLPVIEKFLKEKGWL